MESEIGNPNNKKEIENFDPNSIVMEILAHKCNDKHTQARSKYLSEKEEQMGKVVKVPAGRPARVTTWTVVGNVMLLNAPQTIERHQDTEIVDFDFNEKKVSSGGGGGVRTYRC